MVSIRNFGTVFKGASSSLGEMQSSDPSLVEICNPEVRESEKSLLSDSAASGQVPKMGRSSKKRSQSWESQPESVPTYVVEGDY